jgi:hypothetical protein
MHQQLIHVFLSAMTAEAEVQKHTAHWKVIRHYLVPEECEEVEQTLKEVDESARQALVRTVANECS